MTFNPGPIDRSVLYDQDNHVTEKIWNGEERGDLETIENSRNLVEFHLSNNQKGLIEAAGFGIFTRPQNFQMHDDCLISALIERWRSETNSFHFGFGEMTITLEDVYYILGLPVTGKPLTWGKAGTVKAIAVREFDMELPKEAYGHGGLKFKWLRERFSSLPADHTEEDVWLYTKAFLLYCIGSILFNTTSKNTVHPRYLMFLSDIVEVHSYAWGAAVLAYLYRFMHKATRPGCKAISGCLTLLQVWAYDRLPVGRPVPLIKSNKWLPRTRAWRLDYTKLQGRRRVDPHHHRIFYRGELDSMTEGEVNWRPYEIIQSKSIGRIPLDILFVGLARTPLIHFDIVEFQMPDRVLRQFNSPQHIPEAAVDMKLLRVERGASFISVDASAERAEYIEEWNGWQCTLHVLVQPVEPIIGIDIYMRWYRRISRLRIHNPSRHRTDYQPRGIFDQLWALNLFDKANLIFKKVVSLVPLEEQAEMTGWVEEYEQFQSLYMGRPFTEPAEKHPTEDPTVTTAMILSEPAPQALQVRDEGLMGAGSILKGNPIKPLKEYKYEWLNSHYFNGSFDLADFPIIHTEGGYELHHHNLFTLKPPEWLDDSVMNAYIELLKIRERSAGRHGYYLMPTHFMNVYMLDSIAYQNWRGKGPRGGTRGGTRGRGRATFTMNKNLRGYLALPNQEVIVDNSYVLIPFHGGQIQHWALFLFDLINWVIYIYDSLNEDSPYMKVTELYKDQLLVVGSYLPLVIKDVYPETEIPRGKPKVITVQNRPKQQNHSDCGVLVLKYMDYILQGISLEDISWSEMNAIVFRYRIAHEIRKGTAR